MQCRLNRQPQHINRTQTQKHHRIQFIEFISENLPNSHKANFIININRFDFGILSLKLRFKLEIGAFEKVNLRSI